MVADSEDIVSDADDEGEDDEDDDDGEGVGGNGAGSDGDDGDIDPSKALFLHLTEEVEDDPVARMDQSSESDSDVSSVDGTDMPPLSNAKEYMWNVEVNAKAERAAKVSKSPRR